MTKTIKHTARMPHTTLKVKKETSKKLNSAKIPCINVRPVRCATKPQFQNTNAETIPLPRNVHGQQ